MTPQKRLFDLVVAAILTPFVVPLVAVVAVLIWRREGGPIFHASERMTTPTHGFTLWKFRTMRPDPTDSGVTGADKADRITPLGRALRRSRLDELPQLWNLWRGDVSVVGPRPPLRQYVERFPQVYDSVLKSRPGITGLATILYNRHEAMLLARTSSRAETDAVYGRNCVPRKARIDLIYQRNQSLCFDMAVIAKTFLPFLR
jgi:lipopolysaccharide/colanic/teichoic acid biosynthesis glycosyltransferase